IERRPYSGRLVAERGLELIDLGVLHRARHGAELRRARDERRRSGARALSLHLNLHARVESGESFRPKSHQVIHRIRADAIEIGGNAARLLVRGNRLVDLQSVVAPCAYPGKKDRGGHDRQNLAHDASAPFTPNRSEPHHRIELQSSERWVAMESYSRGLR